MNDFVPINALDRAIVALQKSAAATAEFYRQLSQGELWLLIPFHPEVEGEVLEIQNGSPLPFATLQDSQGEIVPLFSSEKRLEEGLKNGKVPPRTFSASDMPALQVLEILGKCGLRAVINKSCATGEITIPPDLMRDLASGAVFESKSLAGAKESGRLNVLNAADYPTDLIQPVFEFVRRHKNFRAAWIFTAGKVGEAGFNYQLLFLMQPRDEKIFHDLSLAVGSAKRNLKTPVRIGLLDENNAEQIAELFNKSSAFYVAADHQPPKSNG